MFSPKIISPNSKIYPNLVEAVVKSLQISFFEKVKADKVIEKTLKSDRRWGARDRAFIAENFYEIIRWWRLLIYISGIDEKDWEEKSVYQLVNTWIFLNTGKLFYKTKADEAFISKINKNRFSLSGFNAITSSIPDWLHEEGLASYGDDWERLVVTLNTPAKVYLRANTFKGTKLDLAQRLIIEGIETEQPDFLSDGLVLSQRKNVFATTAFKEGWFEVQDGGSQLIAPLLDVRPGMRVCDACAGAGGKTLHLSNLMQNKGKIIAMDIYEQKLKELQARCKRNGAGNVETRLIESKTIKRLFSSFDRLLLDVPCSGTGVIRRNPDAKWKLEPNFISELEKTQQNLINNYSKMLRPGGKMVYATCSILPRENEMQVRKFLEKNPNFELIKEIWILPHHLDTDGFYAAVLLKS